MTGVILAGGRGTRLAPLTKVANKHLLPVYDKPMIYYPLKTLKDMGCTEVVIVSGGEHVGGFAELLGSEHDGMRLTYRVQGGQEGVASALLAAEGLTGTVFPVILGDNYLSEAPKFRYEPLVFTSEVEDPERFGVYQGGTIVEKPTNPTSNKAVIGFYIYDEDVFNYIKTLSPSDRGELEITDVNNWYLKQGCRVVPFNGYWRDMGTHKTLMEVANYEMQRLNAN